MVLQDQQLFRGAADRARHARPLAGKSPADAEELDRPLRRPAGPLRARSEDDAERRERARDFHDAAGHLVRRQVHGDRAGSSAGDGGGEEQSEARGVHRRVQEASAPRRPRSTPRRSSASTPASGRCIRSIRPGQLPVYVANFILMEYGTGAIFGCPAHDQRDLDFVNKYDLGNMPVVCPPGQDPKSFVITDTAYDGDGTMINSRFLDGMTIEQAKEEVAKRLETETRGNRAGGAAPGQFPPARLGHLAAALLGLPDPDHPLREVRRRAGAGEGPAGAAARRRHLRQARQSARPPSDLEERRLPAMRRRGAARDRHHGHVRRLVVVLRALHRSVEQGRADRPQGGRRLAAGRSVHRRHRARDLASALLALLHPRDESHRPRRHRRAVRRPVHPGHGGARDLPEGRTANG